MQNAVPVTIKAISVRQPWAWLLIHGTKDIENRDWYTSYRGPIAIHAAKGMTRAEYDNAVAFVQSFDANVAACIPARSELVRGAVIGTMVLRDCVRHHRSPWFQGTYGFVMDSPEPWDAALVNGALGIWDYTYETEDE